MKTATRDWLMRGLLAAAALGTAAWVASCTEWVDVEVPIPLRGEAAKNDLFITQQLVRRLGATVAAPGSLSELPPPRATLLLTSWYWDLFPERAKRLKTWVENGGHLVLYANNIDHEQLKGWLPIKELELPRKGPAQDDADDEEAEPDDEGVATPPDGPASSPQAAIERLMGIPCQDAFEPDAVPPAYADGWRHYKVCTYNRSSGWLLKSSVPPLWAVEDAKGPLLLRAPVGRGQVTVIRPWGLLDNDRVLKGDNGLLAVAALQARAGAAIWFVTEEARPPLLPWLWHEAWVVVVLGAAALALALWRGARRFGPLVATATTGRRSMAEQISGTSQFLRRNGPEALLGAQIRALEAAARGHVRLYDKLDRTQRAQAIAQATGLDATALGLALDKGLARKRVDLPATLQLIETARRLLLQRDRNTRR